MKLSEAIIRRDYLVTRIEKTLLEYHRFMEMGIMEDTVLRVLFKTPLNDIIALQIGTYILTIRKEAASQIEVRELLC